MRRRAAVNDGAQKLKLALGTNGKQVLHKMGDDDLSFHDPNDDTDSQIKKLKDLAPFQAKTMFTFGYDLSKNIDDLILKDIISQLYKLEMKFRKEMDKPIYPIEPTTYYFTYSDINSIWPDNINKQMGEGETLKNNMKENVNHVFIEDITEETAAGKRNDDLISIFKKEYATDGGLETYKININEMFEQIFVMNQSYFNPKTALLGLNEEEQKKHKIYVRNFLIAENFTVYISAVIKHNGKRVHFE